MKLLTQETGKCCEKALPSETTCKDCKESNDAYSRELGVIPHPEDVLFKYVAKVINLGSVVDAMEEYMNLHAKPLRKKIDRMEQRGVSTLREALSRFQDLCYKRNKEAGWHSDLDGVPFSSEKQNDMFPTRIALIHSEITESFEGFRKDLPDDKLPHRAMAEVELADATIRIFDLAGAMGYDLSGAIIEKMEYNRTRADHKRENRIKKNGKKF
ncbi:hypothetical protein [Parapedobacter indicus]|uniref:MazG nucleotide pyrophosphohydrolase domain-containing protein n=1 Tax=Parapedobacter indicus TaxID=1477437 RepID=A0A1I3V1F7_9SPHI|nr:hypothetical protein [Parapedobacter indicus]PPK99008.1 hypothetical protein CLV26_11538 [Parapedobacter indicus]SFJ88779.1 hypothetical protein SAMN05444682_115139 [Parapedobacter indicus]